MELARVVRTTASPAGGAEPWAVLDLGDGALTEPVECAAGVGALLVPGQRVVVADVGAVPGAELVVVAALPQV